jgi:phospholipid/cholesterol/gamma-HCH transport system substrate-binding protein
MSQGLSRLQSLALGLVVLIALALGAGGLYRIAAHQGLWAETFEVTVGFAEVHDITPGTAVRIRGVNAGQVVAVEYPDHDAPGAVVMLRLKLDAKFADRLYADSSASLHSTGLLSAKVVAVNPGTPGAGPLTARELRSTTSADMASATAKFGEVADEAKQLLHEVRTGNGTLAKLVKDDDLYQELRGLAKDSRKEVTNVQQFVEDGRATMRSVRQGTDALNKMPLIRSYVEDPTALLVRPTARREGFTYNTDDIFEPGTAILNESGKRHLDHVVGWLGQVKEDKAEVVVTALFDPVSRVQTSTSAGELTRKQAETVLEYLKGQGVHKIGWVTRRKMTALGLGQGPPPIPEREPVPPSYIQVLLFTPQS